MKKLFGKTIYRWYYTWAVLAETISFNTDSTFIFSCYQKWMLKASDIDSKYNLGYWEDKWQ